MREPQGFSLILKHRIFLTVSEDFIHPSVSQPPLEMSNYFIEFVSRCGTLRLSRCDIEPLQRVTWQPAGGNIGGFFVSPSLDSDANPRHAENRLPIHEAPPLPLLFFIPLVLNFPTLFPDFLPARFVIWCCHLRFPLALVLWKSRIHGRRRQCGVGGCSFSKDV